MKWSTPKYLFKEGIVGLWRNRTMALASMGTIILCLLILGMSYSIGSNIDYLIEQMETKFGITAYVKEGLSELELINLRYEIENLPNVASVTYISKEEALKNFSQDNEDEGLFAMFQDDNPLPASLEITTVELKDQVQLIETLNSLEGIDETVYFKNETQSFIHIRNTVNYVCYGIMVGLIVVGLLLMSNTIKLTVYVRKREINIMKYVGATDTFIRVPFLIEGVLVGFIGAVLSIAMIAFAYDKISIKAAALSGVLGEVSLVPTMRIMASLIPMYLALGIGIGFVGSILAIHKHLKV